MKSILKKVLVIIAILLSTTVIAPSSANSAYAAGEYPCEKSFLGLTPWYCHVTENPKSEEELTKNTRQIIINIADIITTLAAYLSLGFIIYGGYLYMLSSGDPGKALTGRKTLTRAFIGLAVVILSNIIVNTIGIAFLGQNGQLEGTNCATNECISADSLVSNFFNWIIGFAGVVAVIFVVIGGVSYITSSGDPSKLQKAKATITYALIGLAIVGLALTINGFVYNMIEASNEGKDIRGPIISLLNTIIGLLGIVSVAFIVIGGVGYMTSAGDPGKIKKSKDTILYACIGLVLVGLAFAIVNFAISTVNNAESAYIFTKNHIEFLEKL